MKDFKQTISIKNIIFMQAVIIIYTASTVIAKFASGQEFLSVPFILFYGLEIISLGVYAILWQQVIKRFELSIAYANRAMNLLWSMLWAVIIFHDHITVKNVLGIILVVIGTFIINTDTAKEEVEKHD